MFGVTLGMVAFIGPLAVHLFFPVIPAVKAAFGLSDALAQLTFSIAVFGMGAATLVYGTLSDRLGRRPVLLSGLGLFLVGTVMAALAANVPLLILGRLVQAIGAGCGFTLVRAIARDAYGPERLVKAIAYLTMFGTLGPMIGLVGTIWGMIMSFQEIATAAGAQPRPEKVAEGISTALFITLEGVSLSVPAIFFFAYFRNRIAQMTMEASRVADRTITSLIAAAKAVKAS